MKSIIKVGVIIAGIAILLLNTACRKTEIPAVSTTAISNITITGVTGGGNVTDDGNADVIARGVCWGTVQKPTINDSHSSDGSGNGSFTSTVTGLNSGTTYYLRAYATNSEGTGYGTVEQFITLGSLPVATTLAATDVTAFAATLNGSVNANYLSTEVTFEYGLTTSYGSTATASQSPVTGNTVENASADLTGLTGGTTYHFRIKTVNSLGTTLGSDMSFTTLGQAPSATTLNATNNAGVTATLNGTVNANYLPTTVTFEYGLTIAYGSSAAATQGTITGNTVTNTSADISDLTPGGITYHFRIKAVNSLGTTYGNDLTFTTPGEAPIARTAEASDVTSSEATLNSSVLANDLSTVVTFEWGLTDSYGNTVTGIPSPVSGTENVDVSARISGLSSGTEYHFRVKAVNALGEFLGDDITFSTNAK